MDNVYLMMVDADNNNNKFYNMLWNGDGTWTAEYGRVGKSGQRRQYFDWQWHKKLDEKLGKGYKDCSHLHAQTAVGEFSQTGDSAVDDLLTRLHRYSTTYIGKKYLVGSDVVTDAMITQAQSAIDQMQEYAEQDNAYGFRFSYEGLLETIPRAIGNVKSIMPSTKAEMLEVVEKEQEHLNVMASSVAVNHGEGKDMAEMMGIDIRLVTDEEEKNILAHLDNNTRQKYVRAFRVENKKTEKRFNKFCQDNDYGKEDIKFLYHGSRNQNWEGILSQGLKLKNNAIKTGKMLGNGLYFSRSGNTTKSMNYTSLQGAYWNNERASRGYLAVYKVAMKNPKHLRQHERGLTRQGLYKKGYDGVYAHAGTNFLRNDELVVYSDNRCTVRYLIEVA